MAASIHIKRSVIGSVGHNSRVHFSYSVVFTNEENELNNSQEQAYKIYRSELKTRERKYTERTGQKLQKSVVTQLSAVVNLEQHHTLKDLDPIARKLEEKFGTKVYQIAIHRDEGKLISIKDGTEFYSGKDFFLNTKDNELYFDKKFSKKIDMNDYKIVKNYHAHIEMLGLDEDGNAIRQKMSKGALREMQDFVAIALKMERGQKTKSYTQDQMKEITEIVGAKADYESTTLYAQKFNEVAKDLGYFHTKTKRKDTHDFKDAGAERENAKRKELAKLEDLKVVIAELRAELKESGGVREDYAKLEQVNKDLKAQIKEKTLTVEELNSKIRELEKPTNSLREELLAEVKALRAEVKALGIELEVKEPKESAEDQEELTEEQEIKKLRVEIKALSKAISTHLQFKKLLETIKRENAELEARLNTSETSRNELLTQNKSLSAELIEKDREIDSKPNLNALTIEINEETKEVLNFEEINTKETYKITDLVKFLVKKYHKMKQAIASLNAENRDLKAENRDLKAENEEKQSADNGIDLDQLHNKIKNLNRNYGEEEKKHSMQFTDDEDSKNTEETETVRKVRRQR